MIFTGLSTPDTDGLVLRRLVGECDDAVRAPLNPCATPHEQRARSERQLRALSQLSALRLVSRAWRDGVDRWWSPWFEHASLACLGVRAGGGGDELAVEAFVRAHGHKVRGLDLGNLVSGDCAVLSGPRLCSLARQCPGLRALVVEGCLELTDAHVGELVGSVPLRTLSLQNCPLLTDHALDALALSLGHQGHEGEGEGEGEGETGLGLAWCAGFTPAGLCQLLPRFPHLRSLNLQFSQANGDVVEAVGANCPRLQCLDVAGCFAVPAHAVLCLARSACAPVLQRLSLQFLPVTDAVVEAVAAACASLTHLCLRGCNQVRCAAVVEGVVRECAALRVLDVVGVEACAGARLDKAGLLALRPMLVVLV